MCMPRRQLAWSWDISPLPVGLSTAAALATNPGATKKPALQTRPDDQQSLAIRFSTECCVVSLAEGTGIVAGFFATLVTATVFLFRENQ